MRDQTPPQKRPKQHPHRLTSLPHLWSGTTNNTLDDTFPPDKPRNSAITHPRLESKRYLGKNSLSWQHVFWSFCVFSSFQELRCSRCEARPKSQSQRLRVCQRQLKLKKGNSERLRSFSGGEFSHENRFYRKHMKICEELSEHVFTFLEEPKIKKPLGNPLIPVPQQDALRLRSQGVNIESYRIIFSHSDSYINTHRR